jgi:7-cyano-7-deazaguanine synthase in queuosine biosynthesis
MFVNLRGDSMNILFTFGEDDPALYPGVNKTIDFLKNDCIQSTFWKNKNRYPYWYNTRAIDLLYISYAVFAADRLSLRKNAKDAWRREFKLYVPLINADLFIKSVGLLQKMLSFLTGDQWEFYFRKRDLTEQEKLDKKTINEKKYKKGECKGYDRICMFSGGLDSFVGAIDILERKDNLKTLFVSHYGGGKGTKEYQDYLKDRFCDTYHLEERDFCQFYAKVVGGLEDTTRSRSFMFFSHAVALASAQGKSIDLFIPENGLISLNIPSTYSRIGTSSTRTTHPYYMKLFQRLIDELGLSIHFQNPYQFKTKGEMLVECRNQEFMRKNLIHTMSCSHPDLGRMHSEKEARHCGYCLPCVIRQAAILRAGIEDPTSYRDRLFKSGPNEQTIFNSYMLGLSKFNPKVAFMTIQMNGPIEEDIKDYTSLYIRGMNEMKKYIDTIKTPCSK